MKIKNIFILIVLIIVLFTSYVFASEPQIVITGEKTAKTGETKNLKVKISSEKDIGVVSGKIEKAGNIVAINVTGINGWNLTYNKDTGDFNIYKAEGAKAEEIINIEYTTSNEEGSGSITISNIKMTSIDYETKNVDNVVNNITISKSTTPLTEEPIKQQENEQNTDISKNQDTNQVINNTVKDTTISNEKIAKTGIEFNVIVIVTGIVFAVISCVAYKKYKNV